LLVEEIVMPTVKSFEDLECWQLARVCQQKVYRLTRKSSFQEDKNLIWQIRKAAISVTSNIAEGFERDSNPELIQFLKIAKGSNGEVRSQLYVALDEGYIDQDEFQEMYAILKKTGTKIASFRRYLIGHQTKSKT